MTNPMSRERMNPSEQTNGAVSGSKRFSAGLHSVIWSFALLLGLFFVFLELLKTHRSGTWSSLENADWRGICFGIVLYTLATGVPAELFAVPLRHLGMRSRARIAGPLAVAAGAAVVWFILSIHREFAPTLDDALVGGALACFVGAAIALPALGILSLPRLWVVALTALAGGATALLATNELLLLHEDRVRWLTLSTVGWTGFSGLVAFACWSTAGKCRRNGANRGRFRVGVLCLSVCAALVLVPVVVSETAWRIVPARRTPEEKPNVVFIILDTLRADFCSAYGGPCETPAMEAVAERGTLFERAYSLAPWTAPSVPALMTSTYPPGLTPGIPRDSAAPWPAELRLTPGLSSEEARKDWRSEVWQYCVRDKDTALAQVFKESGYASAVFLANPVLRHLKDVMRGCEIRRFFHPIPKQPWGMLRCLPFLHDTLAIRTPWLVEEHFADTTKDVTQCALGYLRRRHGQPFFLWLHYMDPHNPYDPPARYRKKESPWPAFSPPINQKPADKQGEWQKPLEDYDPELRPHVRALYEAEVEYVDSAVGRVLAELDRFGLTDCTYVCVTSDHGEELWDHGGWGHGQSLYEEMVHVPLVIAGPGIERRTVETPVSAIDLAPTLAELAGVRPAESWLGSSWAPYLQKDAGSHPARPCFMRGTSNRVPREPLDAVIVDYDKLIEGTAIHQNEFYDLVQDPLERHDISGEIPKKRLERSRTLLETWRQSYPATFEEFLEGEETGHVDRPDRETLEALGYM